MNLRHVPFIRLFIAPTAAEYAAHRNAEAEALAEQHRQKGIELGDQAAFALVQQQHHQRMADMYAARLTVQPLHREKTRA